MAFASAMFSSFSITDFICGNALEYARDTKCRAGPVPRATTLSLGADLKNAFGYLGLVVKRTLPLFLPDFATFF